MILFNRQRFFKSARFNHSVYAGALCLSILMGGSPITTANAQDSDAGSYAAKGLPLGGFRLYPSIDVGVGYDDNVYLTQTDTKSSLLFREIPKLDLKSQWDRHELNLFASAESTQYASLSSQNYNDALIGGDGRLDVYNGIDFTGGASYGSFHLANSSALYVQAPTSPTDYSRTEANAAFNYHPYHFGASAGIFYTHLDYGASQYAIAPFTVSNSDLKSDTYNPFLKLSYEFSPGYSAFVRGDYNTVEYDQALDRNGQSLKSHGDSATTGLDLKVTNLIQGQAFVGYLSQTYEAPLSSISGIAYGANLDWTPTQLWTFHLTASRKLNTAVIANASAEDDNVVRLGADYSIRPNIMLNAHVQYWDASFPGISREDQYPEGGFGVTYFLNNNISTTAGYTYLERDSNVTGYNFTDNRFLLSLNYHL